MATIEEMARLEVEVREKEAAACSALAEHLREAVADLPTQSQLAFTFRQVRATIRGVRRLVCQPI
jgi:hypothetical protein